MKLKKIKLLTGHQNIFLILFAILIIAIFNISFNESKQLKGYSGTLLILDKVEPYNYLKSQNITTVLEKNAFIIIKKMIEKRVHLLSLKNCKFKKKSDLITKINLLVEQNLGKTSVSTVISPVKDVLKCKESIIETIENKLKFLIDKELRKYNNELRYIELLENSELKKYTNELIRIETLENSELKKYNNELLNIRILENNIYKLLDNERNQEKLTILEKFQIDERLFELKTRKNRLKNVIEILSDKENTAFIDEKLFELKNKKNKLTSIIEILSDKENTVFIDEKLFELKNKKNRLNNIIEIISNKKNIVFEDPSSVYEFEARKINYRFIGNTLIIVLLISTYLFILFMKNKNII